MSEFIKNDRYGNERLNDDVQGDMAGLRNQALCLLRLDSPERRRRAAWEGATLNNLFGGRPSESVLDAVNALLLAIEQGTEGEELYGERTARQYREQQQAEAHFELQNVVRNVALTHGR